MNEEQSRKIFKTVIIFLVAGVVAWGLYFAGSPQLNRDLSEDQRHMDGIGQIEDAIENFYNDKGNLPPTIQELKTTLNNYHAPYLSQPSYREYPQDFSDFDYKIIDSNHYEICSTFKYSSQERRKHRDYLTWRERNDLEGGFWEHSEGRHCFKFTAEKKQKNNN